MESISNIQARLSSDNRDWFLAELLFSLSTSARASYVEAYSDPQSAVFALECHNEMIQIVAKQVRATYRGSRAYPDDVFMEVLVEEAGRCSCQGALTWALEQALRQIPPSSAS